MTMSGRAIMGEPVLKPALEIVWSHIGPAPRHRYIPRAHGIREGGWRVYDRKEQRFIFDEELESLTLEALREEFVT